MEKQLHRSRFQDLSIHSPAPTVPRCLLLEALQPQLASPGQLWWWTVRVLLPFAGTLAPAHPPLQTFVRAVPNPITVCSARRWQGKHTQLSHRQRPGHDGHTEYKTDPLPVSSPRAATSHRRTRTLGQTGALVNQHRGWHNVGHSAGAQYIRNFLAFYNGVTRKRKHYWSI